MKKIYQLLVISMIIGTGTLCAQCGLDNSFSGQTVLLTGTGTSQSVSYNAGQYALFFVEGGTNYTISTCGTSAYDTQLTIYYQDDASFIAYNDDNCGLQSTVNFTASRCGYVYTLLDQYSCNNSGLSTPVTFTQNTGFVAPTISLGTLTHVYCPQESTGAININVNPCMANLTYLWSNGATTQDISGLLPGTYSVIVVNDFADTARATYTVNPSAFPVLTHSSTQVNVSCFGGSNGAINVTPSGGTGPYTFNWLPSGPTTEDRTGLVAGTYTVQITDVNGCTGTVNATVTQPTAPVSGTRVVTNVSCFGGSNGAINLTPSGGTPPYTFNWLPSGPTTEDRTGLVAGTYTVQITDANGCTGTVNATLTQPTAPVSGTTVVTNLACFGGSTGAINLTPAGGTPGYTYNWLPSGPTTEDRTGLVAGTYTVQITDANGCTGTVNATLTQPTAPVSGTRVVTNVSCFGGSNGAINLTPSGGTGPYTFNWLPSGPTTEDRTGLVAGTYTVQITDVNGCTGTVNATVTQPTAPVSGTTVVTNVACFGGSNGAINLTPNGGTGPYTFNWLPSGPTTEDRTGLVAGTYTVQITDVNGCTGTVNATLTQPTSPVSGTTVVTNVACFGGSNGAINLTPNGGTGPYTFNWLPSGPTTEDRTGLVAGTYTVQITDVNGCTGTVNATLTQPTSPVSGTTVVTNVACFGGSNGAINLTPAGGTAPYTFNWLPSGPTTEDRTGLVAGTYTVQITDVNGCTGTVNATLTQPTSPVSGTTVVTNVACFGGSNGAINLTPAGGTAPYTFNWLPSGPTTEDRTGLVAGTYTVQITDVNGCTGTVNATLTQPTSPVSGTTVVTNVACFGGSNGAINLTPAGGTAPYTFNWLPSGPTTEDRTGLVAGTYTVQITDVNGCTGTVNATLTQPTSPVSGTTVVTNVACFGGSNGAINLTPNGGTGPYTFNWLPSGPTTEDRTGLVAGTYTVQITDVNGCTGTVNATLTQPTSPVSGTTVVTNVACFGLFDGQINLTPTGGVAPYTFDWGMGIATEDRGGLTANTYTVQITDANGCTGTVSATVTQPPVLTAGSSATAILCNGGSATVTVTGSGGTSPYSGTGTFTASAGTHSYTVTDANGCTATTNITVTEPTALMAMSSATTILCNGGTAVVTVSAMDGTGPYTGTGTFTVSAGIHSYTVSDANGCTATTSITVTQPTALMAMSSATTILCNGGTAVVTVSAMDGTGPYTGTGTFTVSAGIHSYTVSDANGCTATTSITVTQPTALMAMSSATTILCNGGTAVVTVSAMDGTGPYTGEGTFTVSAGIHSYTVSDANGCTATTSITVTQPTALMAMSSATTILCNGGTAVVTVSAMDGTGPYTGEGTFTVSAGIHSYTVSDANGCTASTSVTVTEPSAIASTTTSTSSNCGSANGSVTVTANGGTGAYTYLWSNSGISSTETGLTAGSYTVTITDDNGCTATNTANISDIGAPTVTTTSADASCNGTADASIDNTVSGGTGVYTYEWSNSETTEDLGSLVAGAYSYTVTDGAGCEATGTVTIAEPNAIDVSTSLAVNVISANNTAATSYQWIDCIANTEITGETSPSYTALADGDYAVIITEGACADTSACVTITGTGIDHLPAGIQLALYPNPNNGNFKIRAGSDLKKVTILITDIQGREVYRSEDNMITSGVQKEISLDNAAKGVYYVKITSGAEVSIQKLIIN